MHASLEQLISLRDDEPVSLEVQQHVRGCGDCARALNELAAFRDSLGALADPPPPVDAWSRITAKLNSQAAPRSASRRWLMASGIGLAASVVAATVVTVVLMGRKTAIEPADVGTPSLAAVQAQKPADLDQLMSQSRYLERAVLDLNDSGDQLMVSGGTASAIAGLEDHIALVDYEINSTAAKPHSDAELTKLWQQRVDLLKSLAAVRYVQVTNNGI